ncbi:MAG: A/G-specific adenine glycosylase [Anaerolineae bacterium]|nr:A/G-specific adenine glycosylase [Anaerolineae bacterium]
MKNTGHDFTAPHALHDDLIAWFEAHKADLPWRRTHDPYVIWLSEIMLQQTQVTTVIPYFERFLERFPTVHALANAPLDDVLKLWEGLGYYSRARNLHRAARMVLNDLNGVFPSTVNALQQLPGVGRYTAGAIASLAFGLDAPLLDGNVIRILTRLFDITGDVGLTATKNTLWELAGRLVPSGRAGPWNEGLMELGRRICSPKSPDCDRCPLSAHCEAYRMGTQHERPVKRPKARTPHYDVTAAVIERDDGSVLIAQRPHDGMLGGLWEFPGGKREPGESLPDCLRREIREELGITIQVGRQLGTVRHAYSHFRITLYAFACRLVSGTPHAIECADWTWATLDELGQYAFPVTDQKIIRMLRNGEGQLGMDLWT